MTPLTPLTRGSGDLIYEKDPTYPGLGPEEPGPSLPYAGRGGKDDFNIAPFRTTMLAAYTHLLSNVIRSKRFLSHLILTLSCCLKYKIRSRWEKLAPVIQSIVSRHPNHHSSYGQECEKHHTLLILIQRYNDVYNVTNDEQHELLGDW